MSTFADRVAQAAAGDPLPLRDPTVEAPPPFFAAGCPVYTPTTSTCKVWMVQSSFFNVDGDKAAGSDTSIYIGTARGGAQAVAVPIDPPDYSGLTLQDVLMFCARLNGRWWGTRTLGQNCTTTSTTTKPPCQCTGPWPDMKVTVAGVTADPWQSCLQTDGKDGFCRHYNRTWCLFWNGSYPQINNVVKKYCEWRSDSINSSCRGGFYANYLLSVWLNFPTAGSSPACTNAELYLGTVAGGIAALYQCSSFDPATGGTFTKAAGFEWMNCTTFPATLTVTVATSCSTTTSTTSTSTTSHP